MARTKQELVLAGGGTAGLVKRPATRRDWSLAKERKFLETLAETCNVTLSAKAAKVGNSVAGSGDRPDDECAGERERCASRRDECSHGDAGE